MSNAIKFTRKGTVELSANYDPINRAVEISVIDTGIGIDEQKLKCLFKINGTLQQGYSVSTQGVGIGLTVSNELAKRLNEGQSINVVSKVDEGSRFSFTISDQTESESERMLPDLDINEHETEKSILSERI